MRIHNVPVAAAQSHACTEIAIVEVHKFMLVHVCRVQFHVTENVAGTAIDDEGGCMYAH